MVVRRSNHLARSRPWKNLKSYLGSVKSIDTPKKVDIYAGTGYPTNLAEICNYLTFILFESNFLFKEKGKKMEIATVMAPYTATSKEQLSLAQVEQIS